MANKAMSGRRFGRLVVTDEKPKQGQRCFLWKCKCDCGNEVMVRTNSLTTGNTSSCGCSRTDSIRRRCVKHGMTNSPEYNSWQSMLNRCRNENIPAFSNYGGRGIQVCERWKSFDNFYCDMGPRAKGFSLERLNNDEGYSPQNCVWSDRNSQANNMRSNLRFTWHGETMTLAQWARNLGINYHTLEGRLRNYGWTIDRAFSEPVRGN